MTAAINMERYQRIPPRALFLSSGSLAIPVCGTLFVPDALGQYEALLWLLALVPGFLLAYYRGWRGVATAFAAGMAVLSLSEAAGILLGRGIQDWPLMLGVVGAFIGISLGIGWLSERLHRERVLAQQNAIDLVLILGGEGTIRYASPSAERITGFLPRELVGRVAAGLLSPDDAGKVEVLLDRTGARRRASFMDLHFRHEDGSWRVLDAAWEDHLDDPAVGGVVVRLRDITERRQLEERLRRAYRMEAIGKLVGGLAHDINNVLTAITGNAQLLLEELPRHDAQRAGLEEIQSAATHVGVLMQQLLAFSRQQVLQPRAVDLNALVTEMMPTLDELAGERIEIVHGLDRRLARARVDPNQIRHALVTLVAHMRESMPAGGRLTVRTLRAEIDEAFACRYPYPVATGRYALLAISHTGKRMAEELRAQFFEPFAAGTRGTGLELSSVYGVVKQSGGYIWVEDGPDAATTFAIYLPLDERAGARDEGSEAGAEAPLAGGTVLVVEDNLQVRSLVRRILLKMGFSVLEADDGLEALAVVAGVARPIDLLITDVVMPNLGGIDLAERLAGAHPGLRVLLMSGYTDRAVMAEHAFDPETAFLQKPFTPEEFARKVREVLDPARPAPLDELSGVAV